MSTPDSNRNPAEPNAAQEGNSVPQKTPRKKRAAKNKDRKTRLNESDLKARGLDPSVYGFKT